MNMKHDNCKRDMGILLISLLAEEGVSTLTMVLTLILTCLTTSWGGRFFYLTRPLLLGEVPHPLLNTLASPKSFTLGNVQMHLSLHSLNQDFVP